MSVLSEQETTEILSFLLCQLYNPYRQTVSIYITAIPKQLQQRSCIHRRMHQCHRNETQRSFIILRIDKQICAPKHKGALKKTEGKKCQDVNPESAILSTG